MFGGFGKKKTTRKEIPPPINLTVEGFLNNASRIQQPRQTAGIRVDPANPQGQTPGNSIIAGPSAPADPALVSRSPSTSPTSVIGVDPANPQGQTPGNSIIAGSSAPADPAQVSTSSSTSSTSAIGTIAIFVALIVAACAGFVAGIIYKIWEAIPGNSMTSVIGVDPVNPQSQTPGNSIVAGPSAPADPPQVSSSPSTSSLKSVTVFAITVILGVLLLRELKIVFKVMVIIFEIMIVVAAFVDIVSGNIQALWKASPGGSRTSVIGVDPANPQGQTPGNSIIAGPSAPADPAEASSSPSTSSASAQALPQAGGRSQISSSVSIGQDQAFHEAGAAPIK